MQPAFNDSGRVTAMLVQEGAAVHKGDLIATMDDVPYAADSAQARAQAASLAETLARSRAGSRPEEIEQARANMDALAATLVNAKMNYERMVALAPTRAISKQQHDEAKAGALDSTAQQYEAARQTYILAVKGPRVEDIRAAEANVEAAEAAVAAAEKKFAETKLYAPEDGIIENRILEPGATWRCPNAGQTMALYNPLWYPGLCDRNRSWQDRRRDECQDNHRQFSGPRLSRLDRLYSPTAEFTPSPSKPRPAHSACLSSARLRVRFP